MRDLGTLPGDVASVANGINSKGQVLGGSVDMDENSRAFLWQNGVMTDLNTLIPADSPLFLLDVVSARRNQHQFSRTDRGLHLADEYRRSSRLFGDTESW